MIGAVIAMQSEADILLNQMNIERELTVSGKHIYVGRAFGKDIALCFCGIGKVNAALGTQVAQKAHRGLCKGGNGVLAVAEHRVDGGPHLLGQSR